MKIEITEEIKREITNAVSARSCLVEILKHFENNKSLSKKKLFELLKEGSKNTINFFEKNTSKFAKENLK
jgi:hypothetical protein